MKTLLVNFKNVSSDFGSNRGHTLWLIDKLGAAFQIPIKRIFLSYTVGESFQIRSDGYKVPVNQVIISVKTLPSSQIPDQRAVSELILALIQFLSRELKTSNMLYPAVIEFDLGGRKSNAVIYEIDLFEETRSRLR